MAEATLQIFFDDGIAMRLALTIPGGANDEIEILLMLCIFDEQLWCRVGSRGFHFLVGVPLHLACVISCDELQRKVKILRSPHAAPSAVLIPIRFLYFKALHS